jgi:hypothetical protein
MMSNNNSTRVVLGTLRYKSAPETDINLNIPFETTQVELEESLKTLTISNAQIYSDERNLSSTFRPTCNFNILFFNAYSGSTTTVRGFDYQPFTDSLYFVNNEESFATDIWYGYPQYQEFDFTRYDTNTTHIDFAPQSASTYNWGYYITIPTSGDTNRQMFHTFDDGSMINWQVSDGVPFQLFRKQILGRSVVSFECAIPHNLAEGQGVYLTIPGWTGYNGNFIFEVSSLGNEDFGSETKVFNIDDIGYTGSTFIDGDTGVLKRISDLSNTANTISRYYVRKHTVLTNIQDAIITKSGFELNGFIDKRKYQYSSLTPNNIATITQKEGCQSYNLTFKNDIDTSLYVDNLNRPISKIYATIVNRGYYGWFNFPSDFSLNGSVGLRCGWEFNIGNDSSSWWDNTNNLNLTDIPTESYTKDGYVFYYNKFLQSGDTIDGSICEYNLGELLEYELSEIYHKIRYNPSLFRLSNIVSTNMPGYYYKPHYEIETRVFSDYIEEAPVQTGDYPNYAEYSNVTQTLRWRDLYDYGYIDENGRGVEFPYLNGAHYPSKNFLFRIKPEGNVGQTATITQVTIDDCE